MYALEADTVHFDDTLSQLLDMANTAGIDPWAHSEDSRYIQNSLFKVSRYYYSGYIRFLPVNAGADYQFVF
jgi:FMN phosphatase YigB (HAD superfamily)